MVEKDGLSIDLAEKQHNLKILLEDNLRLKQKIKTAQSSALNLINKIKSEEGIQNWRLKTFNNDFNVISKYTNSKLFNFYFTY